MEYANIWEKQIRVSVKLTQGGSINSVQELFIQGEGSVNDSFTSLKTIEINEIGMIPGQVNVWIQISSDNYSIEKILNLGIEKL